MGIETTLAKLCKQIAVYWGNPVSNGSNGFTFDDPVEINCRWEDKKELIQDTQGNEIVSTATVFVLQDLDELGYLYLGTLDDFESSGIGDDPKNTYGSFQIKRFNKIPSLKRNEYIRKVYL